jgi:hypothetical protein
MDIDLRHSVLTLEERKAGYAVIKKPNAPRTKDASGN